MAKTHDLAPEATMQERIAYVHRITKGMQAYFTVQLYSLAGRDYAFLQPTGNIYPIDLDDRVGPMGKVIEALVEAGIFDIVFSLKGVRALMDIPYAITVWLISQIEEQNGVLLFCDVSPQIIGSMGILGMAQLMRLYPSEQGMQDDFRNNP
jgi:hypothetical protein